ncbi:uncharacterized protein PAC_00734 [Phialocephala subalpina]|uniref:Involucrin repeat protein n=1 Tax=Phialocephala subalpina TaxID=576137 RepID=A0A1L7WDK1_9HELO|nr:uncharacterized protein PAC_00734 [Phialocephala subalpina]
MADRRRRSSPAQSHSSRRKHDSRRSTHYEEIVPEPIQQSQQRYEPDMRSSKGAESQHERERAAYASSYSSSSSSSLIDISRTFPPNRSGIRTFFTAPSEHRRKLRRRRSSRLFKIGNSSSSSVNSDLAYGTGYIKRPKSRVRSRKGKEIDRERYSERHGERYDARYSDRERERTTTTRHDGRDGRDGRSGLSKAATDAEILAVGAGLAKLAREQNKIDLMGAKSGRSPGLVGARETSHGLTASRGLAPSKISHGSDTFDEDGWESASDDESDASVDSRLAYDNNTKSKWRLWGRKKQKPMSRKNTIVDPRLFGPANSLHGIVTQPVGFGEVSSWTSVSDVSAFGQRDPYPMTPRRDDSVRNSQQSLQQVYPVPTSDPDTFTAGRASRGSVISEPPSYVSTRPGPIPIQQPQPITPVSQSVYEPIYPTRSESGGILKKTSSSSRTPSLAQAALVGVAGAAVGAAIASNRDDRKDRDRQREDELRDKERQKHRDSERVEATRESERREAERRESERREVERRELERREIERRELERKESERRRAKRDSPDRKDKEKRRDREKDKKDDTDRDRKSSKRRDETRDERDERREKRREERRSERGSEVDSRIDTLPIEERRAERPELVDRRTKSEAAVSSTNVDPFQYQVRESAFHTTTTESPAGHRTPTVVTVEREPDFTRKRSYSIKDPSSASEARIEVEYSDDNDRRIRGRDSRDAPLHEAEDIYEETKHFTAPIAVAAVGAAIAAEHYRETRSDKRRDERRRGDHDYDYKSRDMDQDKNRDREAERIQEEADKAYREIVMARKIASQVIRSRSPSPDRSVVDKYKNKEEEEEEEEPVRIVTPPGMEEHKKGPYDAPNADFQLDHVIEPREMHIFKAPSVGRNRANSEPAFLKRDPDAERPRPLLNLVYPTPTPSPVPEKQRERSPPSCSEPSRSETSRSPKSKDSKNRDLPRVGASDIVIGPRGEVIASPTTSTVSKGVTWGENEFKHYEVESPSEHRDEFVSDTDLPAREVPKEVKSSGSKSKGWGAIVAGITGAGIGAAVASSSNTSKSSKSKKDDEKKSDAPYEYRGVVVEPESPPRRKSPPRRERDQSPPSPGPKPASPRSSHMPGGFDDDIDFTATVAAGLQDTGFDPNIVINDPSFCRRDSPPGSNGPGIYHAPFAETVTDLGAIPPPNTGSDAPGFILGEVASTPGDWQSVSPAAEEYETPTKLSKKEQKKRDKQRRQSGDVTPLEEPTPTREVVEEPKLSKKEQKKRDKEAARKAALADEEIITPVAEQVVEEPESYSEASRQSSKKSKRSSTSLDEIAESSREARTVSVPVNAFDDLKNGDDDWTDTEKSKKKRDSERFDSPVRSALPAEIASEVSSSKKSKRDSERYESPPRSVPTYDAASDIGGFLKRDSDRYESPPRSRDAVSEIGTGRSSSTKDKSKRDSERYKSPPRSRDVVFDIGIGRSSSTKDKSKRQSKQYEREPEEVSLPPSTPSEVSRDGDYEDRKSRKSSNRDSGIFSSTDRDMSQSVVSADASRYDDSGPRRKKKSRSGRDDFDDTRSVASAPADDDTKSRTSKGDKDKEKEKEKEKDKKNSIFSSLFGSTSKSSARDDSPKGAKDDEDGKKSKKSKGHSVPDSSSIYGGIGASSVGDLSRSVSNGSNGKHDYDDDLDDGVRSDGEKRRKSRSRSASTTSTKKDSFLGNAGILGAGAGLAGAAAVAITAQQHRQSNAANTNNETAEHVRSMSAERPTARDEILDPEIAERQFRPSIDPQYGDLLPLPPSDPTTPNVEPVEELPGLPESRPDTPEDERVSRQKGIKAIRRNLQETPMKSPSHSAVPLVFKMGNRSTPSSPGFVRSSPDHSPATPNAESLAFPRARPSRPTSWDKSTEYKPLFLPETVARRGSTVQSQESEHPYPELPPSEATSSRSSSLLDFHDALEDPHSETRSRAQSLSLDTGIAPAAPSELLDSTQTTPKAPSFPRDISGPESPIETPRDAASHEKDSHSIGKDVAAVAATAGLVSTLGYFASTPSGSPVKSNWMDDLPSAKREISPSGKAYSGEHRPEDELPSIPRQPCPVDPMTKDRSSYLLRSSPMSRKIDDERDALDSIQERDPSDVFAPSSESARDIEQERQRAFETLSTPREDVDDPFKDSAAQDKISASEEIGELADEFASKSKKDKKDKKKSKGLSRPSTQNDIPLSESSREIVPEPEVEVPVPAPAPVEQEPAEEFFTSKSKKDKKKGKGLSRSSTQDDLTSFGASEDIRPESETPAAVEQEPVEEFLTTKTKKDKKKGKGLSRSSTQDDLTSMRATESVLPEPEAPASAPVGAEPAEDFFTTKSKKNKKKDKKKNKTASAWEPEESESASATPAIETTEEVRNKTPASRDAQEPEIDQTNAEPDVIPSFSTEQTLVEAPGIEAFEDFSSPRSKKDKKDKKKGKSTSVWEPDSFNDAPEEPTHETSNPVLVETPVSLDVHELAAPISEEPITEPISVQDQSNEPIDDFSAPKSKKDKKKDKKKNSAFSWEPEASKSAPADSLPEASTPALEEETPISRDFQEAYFDHPVLAQEPVTEETSAEPIEDFSSPKSKKDKKDKKKRKSLLNWGAETSKDIPEFIEQSVQEPSRELPEPSTSVDVLPQDIEQPPLEQSETATADDFSTPKSKKDKKKRRSLLSWGAETAEDVPEPAEEPIQESSREVPEFSTAAEVQSRDANQPALEEPETAPAEGSSTSKSKKDKKKDKKKKSILSWELESFEDAQEQVQEPMPEIPVPRSLVGSQETLLHDTSVLPEDASATHDYEPLPEPSPAAVDLPVSRDIEDTSELLLPSTGPEFVSETPLPAPEEAESSSTSKSKKDKKDKKKNKSVLTWPEDDEEIKPAEKPVPESTKEKAEPSTGSIDKDKIPIDWGHDAVEVVAAPESKILDEETPQSQEKVVESSTANEEATSRHLDEGSERAIEEPSAPAASEQAEDFFTPKSKKDKKKDKKKGKSALTWDVEDEQSGSQTPPASLEASRDVSEQPSAVEDSQQFDNFSTSKSKKDKKKDKKKGKSIAAWDEPESQEPTKPELLVEETRDVFEEAPTPAPVVEEEDEFPAFQSKKVKKKDKKKGRSTTTWDEPDIQEPTQSETLIEGTRDVVNENPEPAAIAEADDEFPVFTPKKDKKNGKKGKSISSWEPVEVAEPEKSIPFDEPSQPAETVAEDIPTPVAEPEDEFPTFTSKKDKKKDKKKSKSTSAWDTEPEPQLEGPAAQDAPTEESRDVTGTSTPAAEPEDEFAGFVSKKDKKKDKKKGKSSSWEPELETPLDAPITSELPSQQVEDPLQEPVTRAVEVEDEFPAFVSKKDKKKKKKTKSATPSEPDVETLVSETPKQPLESTRGAPDASSALTEDSADAFSTPKSKKDKKKDKKKGKSISAWEPETEDPELEASKEILPEPSRGIVEESSSISFGAIVPQDDISSKGPEREVAAKPTHHVQEVSEIVPKDSASDGHQDSINVREPYPDVPSRELESSDLHPIQGLSENIHDKTESLDPDLPAHKDAIARDIPAEAAAHQEETTLPEVPSHEIQPDVETVEPETFTPDDFAAFETKKGKKKKKGKSMAWGPEEAPALSESSSRDIETDIKDVTQDEPTPEEFVTKSSKKDKKKKGKASSAWEPEPETPVVEEPEAIVTAPEIAAEQPQETSAQDGFGFTETKKGKKKKGKSLSTWEPEPEIAPTPAEPIPEEQPNESFEEFTTPSSEKGKKGPKKSQALDVEDELPADDMAPGSSKAVEQETSLPVLEIPSAKATPMGGPGAWPITPATPVTGGEARSGQVPGDKSKDYFPSAALLPVAAVGAALLGADAVHDRSVPEKDMSSESAPSKAVDEAKIQMPETETESKPAADGFAAGYNNDQLSLARQLQEEFGSGSKKSKKDKSKRKSLPATPARQASTSRSRAIDDFTEDHHRARSLSIEPARSGVSPATDERPSLYSEEQLELARQLKEEFGSGSKKSKKDKKKKRDLSEPPAQEDDFAREIVEEPQTMISNVGDDSQQLDAPGTLRVDGFAAGYQEDQLSLARQLQAEFGSGSKKSKKDKKRRSTSQTPRDEEPAADGYFGERSQPHYSESLPLEGSENAPEPDIQATESTHDGLVVGYSEDQLELARQLKEDFGSGSKKKSKKDKKRQSLLRGTTEDDFSSDAFMGASEQQSGVATPLDEGTRDASMEPEDAFATVSKKSKKDKKGKKRETSLVRGTTDEDFTPQPAPEIVSESKDNEPSEFAAADKRLDEPTAAEPEDEFAPVTKKSKKEKKGKKRESIASEEFQPKTSSQDVVQPRGETPQPEIIEENIEQPTPAEPEDEFASVTKKGKKDKKGKKRDSLIPDTIEEVAIPVVPAEIVSKREEPALPETSEKTVDLETPSQETSTLPADDDFDFPTKKLKKDKKNRKSTAGFEDSFVHQEPESTSASQFLAADVTSTVDVTAVSSGTDIVAESDEFGLGRKPSKKERKKRQSLLQTSTFDEPPEQPTETRDVQPEPESQDLAETHVPTPSERPQDDEFEFSSKRSKKDKKKQKSLQQTSWADDTSMEEAESSRQPEPADDQHLEKSIEAPSVRGTTAQPANLESTEARDVETSQPTPKDAAEEAPLDMFEHLAFIKKSKKDKKRKDATKQDSEETSGISTPMDLDTDLKTANEPSFPSENITPEQAEPPTETLPIESAREVVEEPVDDWSLPSKKSKKDKKKKKGSSKANSGTSTPLKPILEPVEDLKNELPPQDVQEPVTAERAVQETTEDLPTISKDLQDPDDEWGYTPSKKSKKDKKKRKSGISTPIEEAVPEVEEPFQVVAEPASVSREPIQEQTPPTEETFARELDTSAPLETKDIVPEPEDEWSLPSKKSKKDKNHKSGILMPNEEPLVAQDVKEEVLAEPSQPSSASMGFPEASSQRTVNEPSSTLPASSTAKPEDEWGFSSKKSKKDKKKRKSGLSTPIEEALPSDTKEEVIAGPSLAFVPTDITPGVVPTTTSRSIQDQESSVPLEPSTAKPNEEWGGLTRKMSKKDKKKRKSGLSTPIEEPMAAEPPMPSTDNFGRTAEREVTDISTAGPASQDLGPERVHDLAESQENELSSAATQNIEEQEPVDEFAFVTKRSKKDKQGKKAPRGNSESEPSSFVQSSGPGPIDLFPRHEAKDDTPEVPERLTSSPVSFEKADVAREAPTAEVNPDSNIDTHHEETRDIFPSDLSRKSSKKDKRKRQATVIVGTDDGQSTAKAPLTSWADEVEEAEVVRDHPIIEDLAKDEALSHIPSTTESAPVDDFLRPTKKGKKGKKRNSGQVEPAEIPHPPIGGDLPRGATSNKSSNIPALATVAGATLASAALMGKSKESSEETSTSEVTTPVRKLSKKEKRKQSIDKRTPTNDIFDDPALWEGEKPRAYEGQDDDDGFWSPPREGGPARHTIVEEVQPEVTARECKVDVAPRSGPASLFPSFAPDAFSRLEEEEAERKPEIDQTPISFSHASRDVPHQDSIITPIGQPYHAEPRSIVTTPPEERNISFEGVTPISQEHISAPHRDFAESRDADSSFIDSPIEYRQSTPLSSRKYARLSMPVVQEETLESERHSSGRHHDEPTSHRDSAYESPIPPQKGFSDLHEHVRDSGVHLRDFSPAEKVRAPVTSTDDAIARLSWPSVDEETETVDLHNSQRPKISSKKYYEDGKRSVEARDSPRPKGEKATDFYRSQRHAEEKPILHHEDGPSSRDTLPSQKVREEAHTELHRTSTIHGSQRPSGGSLVQQRLQKFESPDAVRSIPPRAGNIVKQRVQGFDTPDSQRVQRLGPETPDLPPPRKPAFETPGSQRSDRSQPSDHDSPEYQRSQKPKEDKYAGLTSAERPPAEKPKGYGDLAAGAAIAGAATLGFAAARKLSQEQREQRPGSAQSIRSSSGVNRLRTPDLHRPDSVNSNRSGTPPLRRSDRKVADLRSLSQRSKPDLAKEAELAAITASTVNTANPTANEGRVRAKDMADVYDGFGEGRMGSPRSPTRPHSMRRRQSMQVLELENRVDQLANENRMLAEFKAQAERNLHTSQAASSSLVEKDAEIDALKRTLDWLQHEVTRLTEVNEGLTSANAEIARQHSDRYVMLETQHAQATRELAETRNAHTDLSSGMEGLVRGEVQKAVQDKDQEIAQLRAELDVAKEKIRDMQRQILAAKANEGLEFLTVRDEDYFDNACQQLCQHVQQWVLRFSKFSDMRACRLTSEINNDKTIDRLDNAILDGSDVDNYLADRVKRRDVFMSMTMTMVWEFVFTRYLFGMDREQRQKLKSLEKTLSEVGPASAVHSWRATTLTLLSRREAFKQQREQDTQAVVNAIIETLSEILPPPSNLEAQIEDQLTRVMKAAVDLSIEMRCQRAEYMMLPPLQPEYDANGDLASKVSFNAALMNERSGDTVSNEDLEAQKAIVRIVLFPLVVKKGDDSGEGDEEIVVCPAQVLVAKSKKARFTDTAQSNHSRMSMQSSMPADAGEGNVI